MPPLPALVRAYQALTPLPQKGAWKLTLIFSSVVLLAFVVLSVLAQVPSPDSGSPARWLPGQRVLLDAHNCYPYNGRWADRLDRALGTGTPLAIEQDLFWFTDKASRRSWSVVSHGKPVSGTEPTLETYFLERIRPVMEEALRANSQGDWPLITLNLDFKTNEPEHLAAIWELLGKYEAWLSTAERVEDPKQVMPIDPKPLLVLTGDSDAQEETFHNRVPVGSRLRLFGAVPVKKEDTEMAPERMVRHPATNYRRWWNNPWRVIEKAGQARTEDWTPESMRRLRSLVEHAHAMGLWIRFYTLNGHDRAKGESRGWDAGYNFGSKERVLARWQAAIEAGVDFVATDQYEDLAELNRK